MVSFNQLCLYTTYYLGMVTYRALMTEIKITGKIKLTSSTYTGLNTKQYLL